LKLFTNSNKNSSFQNILPLWPENLKNMERREIEIMAPVGSYESLMAAIQGGQVRFILVWST
jgi:hypothetical protein